MSEENKMEEFVSYVENMTVLELSKLVKTLEERLGVSAAAPVAVAAAAPAAAAAAAEEEKTEFDVILAGFDAAKKIGVIKVSRRPRILSKPLRSRSRKRLPRTRPRRSRSSSKKLAPRSKSSNFAWFFTAGTDFSSPAVFPSPDRRVRFPVGHGLMWSFVEAVPPLIRAGGFFGSHLL